MIAIGKPGLHIFKPAGGTLSPKTEVLVVGGLLFPYLVLVAPFDLHLLPVAERTAYAAVYTVCVAGSLPPSRLLLALRMTRRLPTREPARWITGRLLRVMLIALVTSGAEAIMEAAPWTPRLYARHGGYVLAVGALLVSARVLAAVLSPAGQAARTDPTPPSKAGTAADLRSPETGDRIRVSTDSLLYIESDGNYVHIHLSGPNGAEHHMLRCSLQHAESRLTDLPIVRCHRRYLVNSRRVVGISSAGRAAVVRLLAERGDDVRVPVARSRAAEVRRLVGMERGSRDSAASRLEAL